jgi:hypothetical protein
MRLKNTIVGLFATNIRNNEQSSFSSDLALADYIINEHKKVIELGNYSEESEIRFAISVNFLSGTAKTLFFRYPVQIDLTPTRFLEWFNYSLYDKEEPLTDSLVEYDFTNQALIIQRRSGASIHEIKQVSRSSQNRILRLINMYQWRYVYISQQFALYASGSLEFIIMHLLLRYRELFSDFFNQLQVEEVRGLSSSTKTLVLNQILNDTKLGAPFNLEKIKSLLHNYEIPQRFTSQISEGTSNAKRLSEFYDELNAAIDV